MAFAVTDFPVGARVNYIDAGVVTSSRDEQVLVTGVVNGPCVQRRHDDDVDFLVPVFSSRDNGREPTTVYVDVRNVMTCDPPTSA